MSTHAHADEYMWAIPTVAAHSVPMLSTNPTALCDGILAMLSHADHTEDREYLTAFLTDSVYVRPHKGEKELLKQRSQLMHAVSLARFLPYPLDGSGAKRLGAIVADDELRAWCESMASSPRARWIDYDDFTTNGDYRDKLLYLAQFFNIDPQDLFHDDVTTNTTLALLYQLALGDWGVISRLLLWPDMTVALLAQTYRRETTRQAPIDTLQYVNSYADMSADMRYVPLSQRDDDGADVTMGATWEFDILAQKLAETGMYRLSDIGVYHMDVPEGYWDRVAAFVEVDPLGGDVTRAYDALSGTCGFHPEDRALPEKKSY